jgi:hypothetical protein
MPFTLVSTCVVPAPPKGSKTVEPGQTFQRLCERKEPKNLPHRDTTYGTVPACCLETYSLLTIGASNASSTCKLTALRRFPHIPNAIGCKL